MIVAERLGLPVEKITSCKGDTDQRRARQRHVRLEVDADRRRRRAAGGRGGRRAGQAARRRHARGDADDIVLDLDRPLPRRRRAAAGAAVGRARRRAQAAAELAELSVETTSSPARRSRSARTSPSSRSTPRPGRSSSCAWSRSTTPARSSTRSSPRARCTAASRTGVGAGALRGDALRRGRQPADGELRRLPFPSAAELPSFETVEMETPTPINPLGAKGIGESGTIGSTPAVQNAVDRRARAISACATSTCPSTARRCGARSRRRHGEGVKKIAVTVNGTRQEAEVEPRQLLVYFLRDQLGLSERTSAATRRRAARARC